LTLIVRDLGLVAHGQAFADMVRFTEERNDATADELWVCQHPPTYTQGLAGHAHHLLNPGDIPVVATNRGGQVTYHGPGQLVAYPLLDLRRAGYFVKEYVFRLEESILRTLARTGVVGHRVTGAPGIYVRVDHPFSHERLPQAQPGHTPLTFEGLGKIAALGIKVSRHCTYHGASLNVTMDLEPFDRINPCGYAGLKTVDLSTMGVHADPQEVSRWWVEELQRLLPP
jgi:lipoyl(octanoyl) transferase